MASSDTTHYKVYRVKLAQSSGIEHEGIALVPAQQPGQIAGRWYHVIGSAGLGMDFEKRGAFSFGNLAEYRRKQYAYTIAKVAVPQFEDIASTIAPPQDSRLLYSDRAVLDPPARDCTSWVTEVLAAAKSLAVDNDALT